MSEFNFSNFESLNESLRTSLKNNISSSDLESFSNSLKKLFDYLDKSTNYTNVVSFMRATGQGYKAESVEFELNENLNAFSKQKDIVLNFFNSKKFSNITLKKLGKAGFSLEEKQNAKLSGKKLEKLFKKNLTAPNNTSPENIAKVKAMKDKFQSDYRKKLETVAKFLPLQTANLFIDLMVQYEKFANFNISDQEKLAKSREIDEELAKIGCVNLKYLVLNERNSMISDMINANFDSEIKEVVQDACSSFYASPMENDNYRSAAIIAETLKISYLHGKGLCDEYGENALKEINFATKTNTMERYVFIPSPAEVGLIDDDTITTFQEINYSINEMFETVFPSSNENISNINQPNTTLSQNFIDNAMSVLNKIESMPNIPEQQKNMMEQAFIEQTSNAMNERLSSMSNNADRAKLTLEDDKLTQTFIHEEDNILTRTSVTVDKNNPDTYATEDIKTEMLDFDIVDENGETKTFLGSVETYLKTNHKTETIGKDKKVKTQETQPVASDDNITSAISDHKGKSPITEPEESKILSYTNLPTRIVITVRDQETKEDTIVTLDENSIILDIKGNETIAKAAHAQHIENLSDKDFERYSRALKQQSEEAAKNLQNSVEAQSQSLKSGLNKTDQHFETLKNNFAANTQNLKGILESRVENSQSTFQSNNPTGLEKSQMVQEEMEDDDVMVMLPSNRNNHY